MPNVDPIITYLYFMEASMLFEQGVAAFSFTLIFYYVVSSCATNVPRLIGYEQKGAVEGRSSSQIVVVVACCGFMTPSCLTGYFFPLGGSATRAAPLDFVAVRFMMHASFYQQGNILMRGLWILTSQTCTCMP